MDETCGNMDERPRIRTCGFERPLHPLQFLSYGVFGIDVCIYVVFVLALVKDTTAIVLVALCYTATVIALVVATVKATGCNPMDPHIGMQGESTSTIIETPDYDSGSLAFCTLCSVHVYARSKHCRECAKCVNVFDHHCMWLNNCIGNANYHAFFATIISVAAMIGIVLGTCLYLLVDYFVDKDMFEQRFRDIAIFRKFPKEFFMGLLVTMLAVNVPLFLLDVQLIFLHCFLASQQLTTYEYINIKLERSPPEDGGEKYKSDEMHEEAAGKVRKITTLPRCMDWIVFCRCGRRRKRRRRTPQNDVERIDTLQVDAGSSVGALEDASENSGDECSYGDGLAETCPAPPGSTDHDGDYEEGHSPFCVKEASDFAVATKQKLSCSLGSEGDTSHVCKEIPYESLHIVATVPNLH